MAVLPACLSTLCVVSGGRGVSSGSVPPLIVAIGRYDLHPQQSGRLISPASLSPISISALFSVGTASMPQSDGGESPTDWKQRRGGSVKYHRDSASGLLPAVLNERHAVYFAPSTADCLSAVLNKRHGRPLTRTRRSARLRAPPSGSPPPDGVLPLRRRPPLRRPQQAPRPPAFARTRRSARLRAPPRAARLPTSSRPSAVDRLSSAPAARLPFAAHASFRPTVRPPFPIRRRRPTSPLSLSLFSLAPSSPPSRMELSVVNHHDLHVSRAFYAKIRDDWLNTDVQARYYAAYIAATHPCPSSDADLAALNTALKVELGRAARTLAVAYPRYAHDAIGVVYALEVVLDDGRKVFKIGHTMHPSTRLRVLSLCRKRLWGAMWRVPWRIHLETVLHVWFGRAWIGKIRCANCKKRHQEHFDAAACGGRVGVVNAIEGVISLGVKERPADIGRLSADIGRRSADIGRYIFRSGKLKVDQI
ncbi:hypothetical protein GGX14DRAFT_580498 [Mycena pura]|uniref:Bacteriophage T5 Orf172 DNA-binding domain-containing protein n=1 Tax=Mycena pura TaxID=153505 RepID=A0AAD6ULF6_9AGAR|nr:hypothetical protein GGX14DRAFT_580498 [Mycena pura]